MAFRMRCGIDQTIAQGVAGGPWMFSMMLPSALAASLTLLPTTPSGALWLFCVAMIACEYMSISGSSGRLVAA